MNPTLVEHRQVPEGDTLALRDGGTARPWT